MTKLGAARAGRSHLLVGLPSGNISANGDHAPTSALVATACEIAPMGAQPLNFLDHRCPYEVAAAMIARSPTALGEALKADLTKSLSRHLREAPEHSFRVSRSPDQLPAWALGKTLVQALPNADLQHEVDLCARVLTCGSQVRGSARLRETDSDLDQQIGRARRGVAHRDWLHTVAECTKLDEPLFVWRCAQKKVATRRILRLGLGRRWRRLRSGLELWEAAKGTRWCIRKGGVWASREVVALARGACELWVLEENGRALALARFDPDFRVIDELKDRDNALAHRYRGAVRRLCDFLGVRGPVAADDDLAALGIDRALGRPSCPHWVGVLQRGKSCPPIGFRLWVDGRRQKYLLQVDSKAIRGVRFQLGLSVKDGVAEMIGSAPPEWARSPSALMRKVLVLAHERDRRHHYRRTLAALRKAAR